MLTILKSIITKYHFNAIHVGTCDVKTSVVQMSDNKWRSLTEKVSFSLNSLLDKFQIIRKLNPLLNMGNENIVSIFSFTWVAGHSTFSNLQKPKAHKFCLFCLYYKFRFQVMVVAQDVIIQIINSAQWAEDYTTLTSAALFFKINYWTVWNTRLVHSTTICFVSSYRCILKWKHISLNALFSNNRFGVNTIE